jgi:hypothetical protein
MGALTGPKGRLKGQVPMERGNPARGKAHPLKPEAAPHPLSPLAASGPPLVASPERVQRLMTQDDYHVHNKISTAIQQLRA